MNRFITLAVLLTALAATGCYRTVEGSAYWLEEGDLKAFDGSLQPVTVECRAGRTAIITPTDSRILDHEVEAVLMQKTNIRTIERSPDGMLLYEVTYALGDRYEVVDISRDVLTAVTISSLSR